MSKLLILGAAALVLATTTDAALYRPTLSKDIESLQSKKQVNKSSFKHKPTNTNIKKVFTKPSTTTLDEESIYHIGPHQSGNIHRIGPYEEESFAPIQIGPHQGGNIIHIGPYEEEEETFAPIQIGPHIDPRGIIHIGPYEEEEETFRPTIQKSNRSSKLKLQAMEKHMMAFEEDEIFHIGPHQSGNIHRIGPYEEDQGYGAGENPLSTPRKWTRNGVSEESYWPQGDENGPFTKPIHWGR